MSASRLAASKALVVQLPAEVKSEHPPTRIGSGQIAPYHGTYHLVFASSNGPLESTTPTAQQSAVTGAASEEECLRREEDVWWGGLARFFDFLGDMIEKITPDPKDGSVRKPGRSAKVPEEFGEGVAALIPYKAIEPRLACKLVALLERSEKAHHEHSWMIYQNGESIHEGDMFFWNGRAVQTPLAWNQGQLLFDFHTHPPITSFGGTVEDVRPVGTKTNQFSPEDIKRFKELIEIHPNVVCAALTPDGLLLNLKVRSADPTPTTKQPL